MPRFPIPPGSKSRITDSATFEGVRTRAYQASLVAKARRVLSSSTRYKNARGAH